MATTKKPKAVIICESPLKGAVCEITGKTKDGRFVAKVLTGPYAGEQTNFPANEVKLLSPLEEETVVEKSSQEGQTDQEV